jgi:hypothetical protein
MSSKPFPHGFDPTSSVIFLGAGFSTGATNANGTSPPTGLGLETEIKKLASLPEADASSLQDLSQYAVDNGCDLFGLLNNLYSIRALSDENKIIINQPWLRIYTTNYDDSVELFWREESIRNLSFSLESSLPSQIRQGSIIHLHGYINACTREDLLRQLVLTHYSYAQQRALSSPWWQVFERDIRVAQNIFFVGYELNDFEPASYLSKNPELSNKTHFILRPAKSPVLESRLNGYGTRHSFAVQGFAQECLAVQVAKKPQHANALQAFRYFDLLKDDKVAVKPSPLEIQSLLTFGKFNIQRLLSTFPKPSYIAPRERKITETLEKLNSNKAVILHSKIGNGKSIFKNSLMCALSQKAFACYEVRENVVPPAAEIEFLRSQPRVIILFSDYDSAFSNIHLFSDMPENTKFIIEMNTGTLQVRRSEVFSRIPTPIDRVDLNYLSSVDCDELYELLDKAGLAPKNFKHLFKENSEMRDIVLSVFDNVFVAGNIDKAIRPLLQNADAKMVLLCSAILKALGLATDPSFLRAISRVDAYRVLSEAGEGAYEFVDFSHDRVEPHSSLFSEFLIRRYLSADEFAAAVFRMASEAARRMNEEKDMQSGRAREARTALGS